MPPRPAPRRHLLERQQRLSQSVVWQLQRAFFDQRGLAAWSEGIVPHYVTSTPRMANAYARVVLGFLADWQASQTSSPTQEVFVIELGAGSGRFGHRFIQKLRALQPPGGPRVRYVMTDVSQATLHALDANPSLKSFIDDGSLDFAAFDLEHPGELYLRHAGQTLSPTPDTPLIVLANYVFDSVRQDCFTVRSGRLLESLVTTTAPPEPAPDLTDPALLQRLRLTFSHRPADPTPYYPDQTWNAILRSYAETLPDTTILFPTTALAGINFFRRLSGDRLLVLAADKGVHRADELAGRRPPLLTLHGSFSFMVNFHALAEYARRQGGRVLEPDHRPESLRVCGYSWGLPSTWTATPLAYADAVEQGGPDDFYTLKKSLETRYAKLGLQQLLSYLRLSGWDSDVLLGCWERVHSLVGGASSSERLDLAQALEAIWQLYLPLGEHADLAFVIGTLLYELDQPARALTYFECSTEIWGPDPSTAYNKALCHKKLGHQQQAIAALDEALALEPTYAQAARVRHELTA